VKVGTSIRTQDVRSELQVEALACDLINRRVHDAAAQHERDAQQHGRKPGLPIVVERMELRLFADKVFCGSLDGRKIGQVKPEKADGIFPSLSLELFDDRLGLLL